MDEVGCIREQHDTSQFSGAGERGGFGERGEGEETIRGGIARRLRPVPVRHTLCRRESFADTDDAGALECAVNPTDW